MIKVRLANLEDCNYCHELSKIPELKTPFNNEPPLYWFQNIVKEKQILLVAEYNNIVVGFRMGERIAGNWAIAHLMAVHPDYQNKGVGTKLVLEFEKECRKRKLHGIMTYIYNNSKTINFFKENKYSLGSTVIEGIKEL